MPRRGFTLVELLVVIGVIAVLASLAIPAIGYAQRKAREAKCRTLIAQVQAGLESFRTSVGTYPEGPASRSNNGSLARVDSTTSSWSEAFGQSDKPKSVSPDSAGTGYITDENWRAVNSNLLELLSMVSGDNFRYKANGSEDERYILDPFGVGESGRRMVLRYRPARFFPFNSAAKYVVDQDDPPGRDSYQIWSCGRDGTDQYGAKDSDDVTSWEKR